MSQGLATPFLATTTPTTTVYTSGSGTYTTPNNVQFLIVEVLGGGGGGGGAASASASQIGAAGGGGAGGYARLLITSPAASYSYAVGAGGTAGTAGANGGGTGGTTTFGASLQATGGTGGQGGTAVATSSGNTIQGGSGGVGSNGTFNCNGAPGGNAINISGISNSGVGGSSLYGGGGLARVGTGGGNAATNYGSGGSGATAVNGNQAGAAGSGGLIVISEYYNVLGVSSNLNLPLPVDQGGSGRTSATAYGVICGGTTSTGAHQSIASVGTSGQVLTSNGAGSLPTFQSIITDWVAYTPTFTGLGTVSNVQIWSRRVGDTLHIRGRFQAGTVTATEAQMTLGYAGSNSNVTSSSTKITDIQLSGGIVFGGTGATFANTLIESNKGYITFGYQSAGNAGLTKLNGNFFANSTVFSIMAEIPIASFP